MLVSDGVTDILPRRSTSCITLMQLARQRSEGAQPVTIIAVIYRLMKPHKISYNLINMRLNSWKGRYRERGRERERAMEREIYIKYILIYPVYLQFTLYTHQACRAWHLHSHPTFVWKTAWLGAGQILGRGWLSNTFYCTCLSKFLILFTSIETVHIQVLWLKFQAQASKLPSSNLILPSSPFLTYGIWWWGWSPNDGGGRSTRTCGVWWISY